MKCLNEGTIQEYIDNELHQKEKKSIKQHIANCSYCANNVKQQKERINGFKKNINMLKDEFVIIPPLKTIPSKNTSESRKTRKLIYLLSAACILLLIMFTYRSEQEKKDNNYTLIPQDNYYVDANRPITDQGLVITAINPDGQITEYIIE